MNIKEWQKACKENWFSLDHKYDNASREIQKSLKYNPDPNATVRHHLRDTEEQRKYNDEHYELWGFEIDENGNEHFEYGKYVIFVTKEEHSTLHACLEETRKKRSESMINYCSNPNVRAHRKEVAINLWQDENYRNNWKNALSYKTDPDYIEKQSKATKTMWQDELYRNKLTSSIREWSTSDSVRQKRSENAKLLWQSDEYREKRLVKLKETNSRYSYLYKEYKNNGGTLSWNEFRKSISKHSNK